MARHEKGLGFWILSTRMAPIAAALVPLFLMFRGVGLVNTIPGALVTQSGIN